jgi:2-polyprenyl-3-methyl-5-hydroxy-6-metoxy-1,4-benzoquinol methylase
MSKLNLTFCLIIPFLLFTSCKEEIRVDAVAEPIEMPFDGIVKTYEPQGRQVWQKPSLVINLLGNLENKTVADIGAGTGYFSTRLASKAKKVIAVDIDQRFIDYIDSVKSVDLDAELQAKLETRLTSPNKSNLKREEADVVLMVNTYIYIENRVAYLKSLLKTLKPNGRLVIVDFKKKRIAIDYPPASMRMPLYQIEEELIEAGFTIQKTDDCSLEYQYVILAMK